MRVIKKVNFKGVEFPTYLENTRNSWLYSEDGQWIIASRSEKIATFANEADALQWWSDFETARGFIVKLPKRSKPPPPKRKTLSPNRPGSVSIPRNTQRQFRPTSPDHRQALLAKINQGRYDNESSLLRLRKNAIDREEERILNAVNQRLKLVAPETYRKLVGPLHIRDPAGNKKCYCGHPASLSQIANDILTDSILEESLLCDACWEEDICSAWGYYGAWGAKIIDTQTWRIICERRGDTKYATY